MITNPTNLRALPMPNSKYKLKVKAGMNTQLDSSQIVLDGASGKVSRKLTPTVKRNTR